jgi:mRNA interferase YafQ
MAKALIPKYSDEFLADVERLKSQGYNMVELGVVTQLLINKKTLPKRYKDHSLRKRYAGYRDAHIDDALDWILIYRIIGRDTILFVRTGSHHDIFGR